MTDCYLQLRRIVFSGPTKQAELHFTSGVNVICGASDTGKSFLAESIDFMLGGSTLRDIPERNQYGSITLDLVVGDGEKWCFSRATSGGGFRLTDLNNPDQIISENLKHSHGHDKTDNLSGFLLNKIGLIGKRILKSSKKGKTQSLSFRNLARLSIVQEGDIQQTGSPFWDGQFTLKTAELATIKLLLTGIDDSNVVAAHSMGPDNSKQVDLIKELLADLATEMADVDGEQELSEQIHRLESSISEEQNRLTSVQRELDSVLNARSECVENRQSMEARVDEISELLSRFELLRKHYIIDIERLKAIQESGSMFAHIEQVECPLCGAPTSSQHITEACGGNVEAVVIAASSEIIKIEKLRLELVETVIGLQEEASQLRLEINPKKAECERLTSIIQEILGPQVGEMHAAFSVLVEKRSAVQNALDLYTRSAKLQERMQAILSEEEEPSELTQVTFGIPVSVAHSFSSKVKTILNAWNFPGDCHVYFDNASSDFVIDGKPRGSRGKGLRAITHAAITIGLLEYCQEHGLSHPGFVVLDSPLLAYFKPEGADDLALQGSDLKERFYEYLLTHHGADSQVIIIENQHPPSHFETQLEMTVFTGNPNDGRFGLL